MHGGGDFKMTGNKQLLGLLRWVEVNLPKHSQTYQCE